MDKVINDNDINSWNNDYRYPFYKYYYKLDVDKLINSFKDNRKKTLDYIPNDMVMEDERKAEKYKDSYLVIVDDYSYTSSLNDIVYYFSENIFIRNKNKYGITLLGCWESHKEFYLTKTNKIDELRQMVMDGYFGHTIDARHNLKITSIVNIFNYFKPNKILDVFPGLGYTLISSILYGLNEYRTSTIDPNIFNNCNTIIDTLIKNKHSIEKRFKIEFRMPTFYVRSNKEYDMVIFSPDRFDRKYFSNNLPMMGFKTDEDWFHNYIMKALDTSFNNLRYGGHFILIPNKSIKRRYIDNMRNYLDNMMKFKGVIYNSPNPGLYIPFYIWKRVKDFKIRKLDITKELNPDLVIEQMVLNDNRIINVVRDDYLVGGTKQRLLYGILSDSDCHEFVYAGPIYGFAQIALSYVAKKLNKKATLVIEKRRPIWNITEYAKKFEPNIIEVGFKANLKSIQKRALDYVEQVKKEKGDNYICNVPFGLNSYVFQKYLGDQIRIATPKYLLDNPPKTMWLVAGSSALLNALYLVFPTTFFRVVQVGKTIWPDQLEEHRTKLYISKYKFQESVPTNLRPPYPSVRTYDAKLWEFFLQDGKSGDYIWNVGKDMDEYLDKDTPS